MGFEAREPCVWFIRAKVAELVDALVLGASGATRESSSLSFRTIKRRVLHEDPAPPRTQSIFSLHQVLKVLRNYASHSRATRRPRTSPPGRSP